MVRKIIIPHPAKFALAFFLSSYIKSSEIVRDGCIVKPILFWYLRSPYELKRCVNFGVWRFHDRSCVGCDRVSRFCSIQSRIVSVIVNFDGAPIQIE